MRIVVLGPTYPYRGGISHYTSALARKLEDFHHQVTVVSYKHQYPRLLYPGRTDHDAKLSPQSSHVCYLLDPISPGTWINTARSIIAMKPDIVVAQWWSTYWALSYAVLGYLLRKDNVMFACQVHNVHPHESHLGDTSLLRLALRQAQGHITWCKRDSTQLRQIIGNAVIKTCAMPVYGLTVTGSHTRSGARNKMGIDYEARVVLFFGYIRPYKGLGHLLSAVAELRDRGEKIILVIAGECWDHKATYIKQIAFLGIADQVRFEDRYIPDSEVGDYFVASDVLVAPYTSDSQSAVAAMGLSFGIPMIVTPFLATRLPITPDTLQVVQPCDSIGLADALSSSLNLHHSATERRTSIEYGWEPMVTTIQGFIADNNL